MKIIKDDIVTIKTDIQTCIANNMQQLDTEYRIFLFDKKTMIFTRSLGYFESLEIKPCNSRMKFKGEIAKDLIFNEEEMSNIKSNAWKNNINEMMNQINESKKTETQKNNETIIAEMKLQELLQQAEETEYEYRKITEDDRRFVKAMQEKLKNLCLLDLDYEEHEESIMLCGNYSYLKFEKEELRTLIAIAELFDMFLIAPSYSEEDEEDEECKSIRIVLGVDLRKE